MRGQGSGWVRAWTRPPLPVAGVALFLCVLATNSTFVAVLAPNASEAGHSARALLLSEVNAAVRSLQAGQGPGRAGPVQCTVGSGSAQCSGAPQFTSTGSVAPAGLWWNLTGAESIRPAAREFTYLTDDVADGYVLLFGGLNQTQVAFGDTWKFQAGHWTQLFPASSPSPRGGGGMVYDPTDGYVVFFGGVADTPNATYYQQTWKFSAGAWTQLFPASVPSTVAGFSMTYDVADHAILMFGGENSSGAFGQTWTFAHGQWTELFPSTSPAPRAFAGIAYDPSDGYTVLFGGLNASSVAVGDTWRYLGGVWTQLSVALHPSPRGAPAMAWDPTRDAIILYGGTNLSHEPTDTWQFVGGGWTLLSPSSDPGPLLVAGTDFDVQDGYLLLFSGVNHNQKGIVLSNMWAYAPALSTGALANPSSPNAGQSVSFTANASYGIAPYTYNWSFGDGTFSNLAGPHHSFSRAETVVVNLTVTDLTGTSAMATVTLVVHPAASGISLLLLAGIVVVVAAVLAVVAVLWLRRRKSPTIPPMAEAPPAPPAPPPPPPT